MLLQFQQFVNNLNKPKTLLLLGNVLLVFFLILFSDLKLIPLRAGDFVFFAFLALALALYRPGWAFLLFVGMLPLENINIAPVELGITIRPYQFFGALTILALIIRFLSKRLYFQLTKFAWHDWLVLIMVAGGFLSTINSADRFAGFKLALIIGTFAALYYLARNYVQNIEDLKRAVPFFLSSSVVVIFYGIWQNWRFLHNLSNFETMPGRPNGTFTEADWLGIFLVLLTSVIYILLYSISNFEFRISNETRMTEFSNSKLDHSKLFQNSKFKIKNLYPFLLLTITLILLILTVSRSAWLGALVVYVVFVLIFFIGSGDDRWRWKETIWLKLKIISSLIVAIGIVYVFHLTNFQLFNRAVSTGTGLQKITIACNDQSLNLPESIQNIAELKKYDCQFINLEDIEKKKADGKFVTEIYRQDPNVQTRSEIYQKSWEQIKDHPILGIGWGSIGNILGRDSRGVILNSSNIFLETYLGAGIIGFLALIILLGYILVKSIKNYYCAESNSQKVVSLFVIASWFAIVIPNLFNAGIFLGFFWVWLAVAQLKTE